MAGSTARLPLARKLGYAFGDYGCNLYWQSISFFLLFFYTDVLGLPVAVAGLIYMAASIFDGCIDPVAGAIMDRTRTRWGQYRPWLVIGALPLAAAFALLYWTPPLSGSALVALVLAVHLMFRVAYTVVAVPLASLSARLTANSSERTTLASLRMMFGAGATATVGFATQPLAAALGGGDTGRGMFLVAIVLGTLATLALATAFLSTREPAADARPAARTPIADYARGVRNNPAFLWLALALLCATLSTTALNKSLLYYFKYVVHDEASARYALSSGAFVSLLLAPGWAVLGRRMGKRAMWLTAVGMGLVGLAGFILARPTSVVGATAFFVWMQTVTVGVQVGYWGMLPDTVEYGEWRGGMRHESFLFGLFMFVQKAGFGLAVAVYGAALSGIGYRANVTMEAGVLSSIGLVMVVLSAVGLIGSGLAVYRSPLRRGTHEAIVADLANARALEARDDGEVVR